MAEIYVPKIKQVTIKRDDLYVLIVIEDRKVLDLPWDAALQLAKAITIQAKRIEEDVKHSQIIADQALLMRSGAPFGITNNPDIIAEAKKEAVGNTFLRKNVSGKGIGGPILGTPTVVRHRKI